MFLCHSFGGYIVKRVCPSLSALAFLTELAQTVSSIISRANFKAHIPSPVSRCVFFSTQHKQIEPQSALMTMLIPSDGALPAGIILAKIRQQTAGLINDINRLFDECIRGDPEMKIVTCYETEKTKGILVCNPAECKTILTNNSIGSS